MGKHCDPISIAIGLSYFEMSGDEYGAALESMDNWRSPQDKLRACRVMVVETLPRALRLIAAKLLFFGLRDHAYTLTEHADVLCALKDPFSSDALAELRMAVCSLLNVFDAAEFLEPLKNEEHWTDQLALDCSAYAELAKLPYRFLCELHGQTPFALEVPSNESEPSLNAELMAFYAEGLRATHDAFGAAGGTLLSS